MSTIINKRSDTPDLKSHLDSIEQNIEEIRKEQVNILEILSTGFQSSKVVLLSSQNILKTNKHDIEKLENVMRDELDLERGNSRKLDGLGNSTQVIEENMMTTEKDLEEIKQKLEEYHDFDSITWKKRGMYFFVFLS